MSVKELVFVHFDALYWVYKGQSPRGTLRIYQLKRSPVGRPVRYLDLASSEWHTRPGPRDLHPAAVILPVLGLFGALGWGLFGSAGDFANVGATSTAIFLVASVFGLLVHLLQGVNVPRDEWDPGCDPKSVAARQQERWVQQQIEAQLERERQAQEHQRFLEEQARQQTEYLRRLANGQQQWPPM